MNSQDKNHLSGKISEFQFQSKQDKALPKCNSVLDNFTYRRNDQENNTKVAYKETENAPTFYKAFVGPGSYDIPSSFDCKKYYNYYKINPEYSIRKKFNYGKQYFSKDHLLSKFGSESPGVGQYNLSNKVLKKNIGTKIGTEKRDIRLQKMIPLSPGPKYLLLSDDDIGNPIKRNKSPSFEKRSKRNLESVPKERILSDQNMYDFEISNSNGLYYNQKGASFGRQKNVLQTLWKRNLQLSKKVLQNVPGPGAYSNVQPIKVESNQPGFSKATKCVSTLSNAYIGPGHYDVISNYNQINKKSGGKFSMGKRKTDLNSGFF